MKQKMITPNCYQLAVKELGTIDLGDYKIPKQIQGKEAPYYVCVCVRSKQSNDKMSMIHTALTRYAMPKKWEDMEREAKSGRSNGMFSGWFQKVVVLHNPNKPAVVEKSTSLSNTMKGKVKKMHNDGIPAVEIANILDADLGLVQAHITKIS